ncbi:hypothetical protein P8A24_04425 [Arcanobacterium wilhelmae]|uniref:hypothetical protein n=1 Tax=Arcanobacterium wilhelmae TaxID=1803177 RepID=UPI0024151602|nr:hypothetical protein [Arcanobacterium wilhelmae]WFN91098.1 hypothetical protein P8A24_04425 [Arcanobacterium wilhelmae]
MAIDPQTAFDQLLDSLEEFHEAVLSASDPDEPAILTAMNALSDAYTIYDDMLFRQFGVEGPFDTFDEDDSDFEEDFDDEDLDDDSDFEEDDEDDFDDEDDEDDDSDFDDDDSDFDDDEDDSDDEDLDDEVDNEDFFDDDEER